MVKAVLLLMMMAGCLGDPKKPAAPDGPRAIDAAADAPADVPLMGTTVFGDPNIEQYGGDQHACGLPEAASFKTGATVATVRSLWIYVGEQTGDDATQVAGAIYDTDGSGNPTQRAATGHIGGSSQLTHNQWYQLPLDTPYTPSANHIYWIAAMCPQGSGNFFTINYSWVNTSNSGAGPCDATATPCTQHGASGETTFDMSWQMTVTFLPSTNSYYASTSP
jgi:hypothetical protein